MKKIFLGGFGCCNVHFEKDMIDLFLSTIETEYEKTDNYQEADVIVITDTCVGNYENIIDCIDYVKEVIDTKRKETEVIVSGCLIKGVRFELPDKQKAILNQVTCIASDKIVEHVCKIIKPNLEDLEDYKSWSEDFELPYKFTRNSIAFSIVEGCSNRCSFCKSNYMNFSLKSIPYEILERMVRDINKIGYPFNYMDIYSSNLSLYGKELYNRPRSHEAIKLLTSPECVKFVNIGSLINFYPELIKEVIENPKIKIIYMSLESGSERIYNLMNRPITLQKLVEIMKLIKRHRPDIIINTELICGFPTETIDDLKRSIELVQELDLKPTILHPYIDSKQIPSSKLPQYSLDYKIESRKYAVNQLRPQYQKIENKILNGEMFVLAKFDDKQVYMVLLIDGSIIPVRYDQFERTYNVNDLIPANTIISKQIAKRRTLAKNN